MNHVVERFGTDHVLGRVELFGLGVSGTSIQRPMFFTDLVNSPTDEWIAMSIHDFARLAAIGSVRLIRLLTALGGIDRGAPLSMCSGRRTASQLIHDCGVDASDDLGYSPE